MKEPRRKNGAYWARVSLLSCVFVFLFLFATRTWAKGMSGGETGAQSIKTPSKTVSRLIESLLSSDFKGLFETSCSFQAQVNQIKANNPEVMWNRLIDEYYQTCAKKFSRPETFWENYDRQWGMGQNDAAVPRELWPLFQAKPSWKIIESKKGNWKQGILSDAIPGTMVYVQLDYSTWDSSPIWGGAPLREIILACLVPDDSGCVASCGTVAKSESYWNTTPLKIYAVTWSSTSMFSAGTSTMVIKCIGGEPPLSCTCRVANVQMDGGGHNVIRGEGARDLIVTTGFINIPQGTALGRIVVTDSHGQTDEVWLTIPAGQTGVGGVDSAYCWTRQPWAKWSPYPGQECRTPRFVLDDSHGAGGTSSATATVPGTTPAASISQAGGTGSPPTGKQEHPEQSTITSQAVVTGIVLESVAPGTRIVFKVDGTKVIEEPLGAVTGRLRFTREVKVAPGRHHLRLAIWRRNAQPVAAEWDFTFSPGSHPVFRADLAWNWQLTVRQVQ